MAVCRYYSAMLCRICAYYHVRVTFSNVYDWCFLQDCIHRDHPNFQKILMQRKYVLQSTGVFRSCPLDEFIISSFLKIINVTESDAGVYTCNAHSTTVAPNHHDKRDHWNFTAITGTLMCYARLECSAAVDAVATLQCCGKSLCDVLYGRYPV